MLPPDFSQEEVRKIRSRYVVDRVDGLPLLLGRATCPLCEQAMVRQPVGEMDVSQEGICCRFFVQCEECERSVVIEDRFHGGL